MTPTPLIPLSIAPMMDWTDKHCRYFHRLFSPNILLYTEMVNAGAICFGDRKRHLDFNTQEHPVALQIGGSDPEHIKQATRIGAEWGYDEINLNCGCPSDRVQNGSFGACLMTTPEDVAVLVSTMKEVSTVPITLKCRLGVDDQDVKDTLPRFLSAIIEAGVDGITIHARKAWLQGLSPKENRTIPPLDYALVYEMKRAFSSTPMAINGGITTLEDAKAHLDHMDSVMIGRAACHNTQMLEGVDEAIFKTARTRSAQEMFSDYAHYISTHAKTERPQALLAPVMGYFNGQKNAKRARQILSEEGRHADRPHTILKKALAEIGVMI